MERRDRVRVGLHMALGFGILAVFFAGVGFLIHGWMSAPSSFWHDCRTGPCATIEVPLRREDPDSKKVKLHVESSAGADLGTKVAFMLGGGPGGDSSGLYHVGRPDRIWSTILPEYTLVAVDARGTGQSEPLKCVFDTEQSLEDEVSACGGQLGVNALYYTERIDVQDLESVRRALGVKRIALVGASAGTRLALAYASAYPTRVSRIVLDGPVAPDDDPFDIYSRQSVDAMFARLCADHRCPPVRFDALAHRLAGGDLVETSVLGTDGKLHHHTLSGSWLLSLVYDGSTDPAVAAALPAAVNAAADRDPRPIIRLQALVESRPDDPVTQFSRAKFLANSCTDPSMPWRNDEDPTDAIRRARAKLPRLTRGRIDVVPIEEQCVDWPFVPDSGPVIHSLPDVPVLLVVGTLDTVTPMSEATAAAKLFPRSHVVIAPGVGHTPLSGWFGTDLRKPGASCEDALVGWAAGVKPGGRCDFEPPLVTPLKPFTARGNLADEIARTVIDARNSLNVVSVGEDAEAPGLERGSVSGRGSDFTMRDYSIIPGLRISGHMTASEDIGYAAINTADLTVRAPTGAVGYLRARPYSAGLEGRIGAHGISVPLVFDEDSA